MKDIPIISFVGYSNSGKTTLIRKILERLSGKYEIGIIKHHGHIDKNESSGNMKDTDVFINSGAKVVRLLTGNATPENVLVEYRNIDLDLVIMEGFKTLSYPKFYIKRENIKEIYYNKEELIGIISDSSTDEVIGKVWFNIDDVDSIVDFIKKSILKGD